ncbi:MAG: fimbrillin family protein [Bacteroidales bacterium]|nr:fimbrillin family protein [Bacteroidales bacterium]
MKKVLIFVTCIAALAACEKSQVPTWTNPDQPVVTPDGQAPLLKVTPVITKVTETKFENGDAIGITVTRLSGVWAENQKLTFDGTVFSGEVKWYPEGTDEATVTAYYPYAAAVPASFTVAADQSAGASASDLVAGSVSGVKPSAEAIVLPFQHKLSLIVFNVANNAGGDLAGITLDGAKLKANLAADFTATVDETASAASVKAFKKSTTSYALILPPQTVELTAKVETAGGNILSQKLAQATLEGGKKYTISMVVNPDDLIVVTEGDVQDWTDGGELNPADPTPSDPILFEEHLTDGYFIYHDVKYNVVQLKDNKWWMAQNLAYVPEGYTPASALTSVTAGVFYPLKVNEGHTAAEFDTSADAVAAKGYLYQAECALGLASVGTLTSVEAAQALEGAQGICPAGWHVPTGEDIINLVGKAVSPLTNNTEAPYYDASSANGSIALLNADGFNMDAFGAISIQDNTKTTGTFMGWASGYPDKISSGMFIGSTYAGVTYNTSGDETSGVKNLQFFGLMPMTNKASESAYTCNGTKVSYRIAGPVRCVRNN